MTYAETIEVESSAEKVEFPVKPTRVGMVEAVGKYVDNLPQGGYSSHEGLIAVKNEGSENIYMMRASDAAYAQLAADGKVSFSSNYAVPYTGGESGDRLDSKFSYKEALLEYNEAAIEAGLKDIDYDQLSDDQKRALRDIGFMGSTIHQDGLLSEDAAFTVSSAWDYDNNSVNASKAATENVGTYTSVDVPINGKSYEGIAFTDHNGREVIAPKNDTLSQLLGSLGYREVEEPTFDALTPIAYDPNEYSPGAERIKSDKIRNFHRRLISNAQ